MSKRNVCTATSRNTSSWIFPVDFDGRREMSSLSLKNALVHKSVIALMTGTNLQKGGLVHRVPRTKSREKLQKLFQSAYACCFANIKTVTNFSMLCVVLDLIFQRKLSRRRLPITFVYFVSHASARALRPITFTQRFKPARHLIFI